MSGGPSIRWNASAEALFRLDRPTAVSAGAGSGKTTALVELCLRLLSGEATGTPHDPSEIAAITFTEKAAQELTERLREALAARARTADPAQASSWARRLREIDRMAVGTIHGFAGRLLREHALEAGVDPEFAVLDEEAAVALREEAARAAVVAAADSGRTAALELCAGFGAGGRRGGLAGLVAEVLRERATLGLSAPPSPSAADAAAAECTRRRLLEAVAFLLAARPGPATASGAKALAALGDALARLSPEDRNGKLGAGAAGRLVALADAVRRWRPAKADREDLSRARRDLLEAAEALVPLVAELLGEPQRRELCGLVAEAEARYGAAKEAARALDFDDLLVRSRDLLLRDEPLRLDLRRRIRALLVDEYQDVNRLQQEIFDLLAGRGSEGPTLAAVGDLKQSIYRFRGADVAVFSELLERFGSGGGGRVLHLAENHRSTPAAIELVNAVFERCMQPAGTPRRYELRFGEADRLVPMRSGGVAPACEILEDPGDGNAAERRTREARAIAARIQALVSGAAGVAVFARGLDGVASQRVPSFGDLALLFRRLTQIGDYERALREAGIPYRMARGGGFYQAPEIRDLGELLASFFEPDDSAAWAALLRSPLCGVSEGTLLLLSRIGLGRLWWREPEGIVEEVRRMWGEASSTMAADLEAELSRLHRFLREWHPLFALRDRLPVDELLGRAADRLDLEAALLAGPDGERKAVNLRKAVRIARRFSEAGGGAAAFAKRLRRLAAQPPREPEAELDAEDAVAILSVHQAKGLEWPVVFVPDLGARLPSEGRRALLDGQGRLCAAWFDLAAEQLVDTTSLLATRAEGNRAAAAESRRLLYVGLTRARDYLVLSGSAPGGREESWAAFVSSAAADCPGLVRRISGGEASEVAAAPAPLRAGSAASAPPGLSPPRLARPPPLAAVRVAVTDLAEYARCPRRHWFARALGLAERDLAPGSGSRQDDPARATARGTLAHAMLCEVDLGAVPLERRAQLAASAARRGHDPSSRGVRRIIGDVTRFLDSPGGRRLEALWRSGALSREVPFLLRIDASAGAPACYLTGAIDALAEGPREVTVVDFKYALPRPQAAARYRMQLLAYALAASRAAPGRRVRANLQFLRGGCSSVDLTPEREALKRFEAEAPALALGAFRGDGERLTPAELGRDEVRCCAEGCGYVPRCYRARPAVAASAAKIP